MEGKPDTSGMKRKARDTDGDVEAKGKRPKGGTKRAWDLNKRPTDPH